MKVRDFGFKPEYSQLLSARAHTASAAAKTPAVAASVPKVERAAKVEQGAVRKTEPKSSKPLTNSEHQAKWRAAHPDAARRQASERMKGLRARRAACKHAKLDRGVSRRAA